MEMAAVVTGDKYLEFLVRFVEKQAEQLIEGTLVLKLNPVGLHYVQSRLESLNELEALLAGAPVDYLRAYVSDLGDHRALEQLRRILRLLTSLKVVSVLPSPVRDPTPLSLLPFGRLKALELRGCDLSTSAARGLLELRHTLEKIICHNSTDALRHVFASRIAEIKDSPVWNRLSFVSCARNGLLLMDESLQLLPVVETLDLSRNKFAKVDNLRKCTRLKHLDLGFNQVRTITSFSEVSSQLVKLVLRNNALTTLRGIENLKCLEGLDLSYNVISNFSELEVLAGLPSLLSLWLEGNPLCCARWYRAQVFSIFLYPDKLRLDDKKISRREFWKIQIIIASRQKQPASFGFYAPAKGDAEVDGTMNTKRKKHSRLACIESEEQAIHTNSDEESIVCENENHSKVEEIISDEEIEVDLVKRIERMKKERSALWLQEFKEWLIQDSENFLNTNNFAMPALNVDNNNLKDKAKHSYHGESSRYVSDTVQASGDGSSTNILESDSSFADHSSVFNAHQYFDGIIEPVPNFSMRYTFGNPVPVDSTDVKQEQMKPMDEGYISARAGNRHPHLFVVPRGERKQKEISIAPSNATVSTYASPGSPPHYQKDILHRRHNLEEEYLQLSAESFSVASSDSNTSCNEDDFTEFGPFIPEGDLSLIEELSERSSHSTLRNSEDMQYHKGNGVSQVAQNGVCISDSIAEPSSSVLRLRDQNNLLYDEHDSKVVHCMKQEDNWLGKSSSYRKPKRRLISLLEENDNMVKKCEEVSSLNGDIDFCVNSIKDKQQRPIHYGGQICVMETTTSFTDGVRSISCPKSSLLGIEDIIEDYFNTEFADRGVNETCRTCICCNCMIEHRTEYREGEVAVLLSSEYKLYVMLLDINHDGSEIRLSIMDCHKIEDVRRVLVGLGLQFLRVYFENGGTYLFITRSVDKSRQLLCLLLCLDSELRKQYCSTESVEQVQVELFQRDICGVLRMSMFQYAMVLFWCNNMEEDIWLSRSLFVLEQHLLVCVEDFMKSGSCRIDPSPYFSLSSVCSIIDVIEMVIDTREGWCTTLVIESATSEFCFLKKMEESAALTTKRTASCSLKWKLKWFSEKGLFNFVAVLKALYAGVANSSSPLIVKCIS